MVYSPPSKTGWGTPSPNPRLDGVLISKASTCYAAGGVPLAFTQEDFLVNVCFAYYYKRHSSINREIGTIIRSLGCCPSEAELHDMLAEVNASYLSSLIMLKDLKVSQRLHLLEIRFLKYTSARINAYFQIEEEEPTGYIRLERFLPMMTRVLMERRCCYSLFSHQ